MQLLLEAFSGFMFFPSAFPLSIPPQNSIYQSLDNVTSIVPAFTSNRTLSYGNLTFRPDVECGIPRTPNLNPESCQNAWEKIPVFGGMSEMIEFRHRHDPNPFGNM